MNLLTDKASVTTEELNSSQERRGAKRYAILAKACFEWQEGGKYFTGTGPTRDISARGAFIRTHRSPPLATDVVVLITLPSLTGHSPKKSQLRGRGTVVRVIPNHGFVVDVAFRILRVSSSPRGAGFGLIG